jgi:predicted dehydrogenase
MSMGDSSRKTSRRQFVKSATGAIAAFTIVPRHVLGQGYTPPSEKLNVACIGLGNRGKASLHGVHNENIVALCDVDLRTAGDAFSNRPKAKAYRDYRKLFDEMGDRIDAVTVATPDHTHAVIAMEAIKRGKHVYCEKPLAHSIHEVRELRKAAHEHKVVTQLGNQGHSYDTIRTFCEWIWDGAIGNVTEVHAACGSAYSAIAQLSQLREKHDVPEELNWDLWLGPVQYRPYHPLYVPRNWRRWAAFGCGVIGDWVCHVVDPVFWALDLGAPTTIQAQAKGYDPKAHGETFPRGTTVTYEFAAKGDRGPVKLIWFEGAERIPRPDDLEAGRKVPGTGAIVIGDKGKITYGSHGASGVRIFPETKMKAYTQPAQKLPRVPGHFEDWLRAVKTGGVAGSNFDYGGPLTEIALLGMIGIKHVGQKLEWDGANARFTNCDEANACLNPPYRQGWTL